MQSSLKDGEQWIRGRARIGVSFSRITPEAAVERADQRVML
jgi:hypothetical protein